MRPTLLTSAVCLSLLLLSLIAGCASKQTKLLESKPQPAESESVAWRPYHHFINGVIYEQEGLYRDALEEYQRALSWEPLNYDIRMALGDLYYRLGQPQEAVNAIAPIPAKDSDALILLGDCYADLKETSKAEAAYLRALALDPENVDVLYQLAVLAAQAGELAKAAEYFKDAAYLTNDPELYEQTAKVYAADSQLDSVAVYYRAAMEASGGDPELYGKLATIYLAADERQLAKETLREGISRYPTSYFLLGQLIELHAGDREVDSVRAMTGRLLGSGGVRQIVFERVGQRLVQLELLDLAAQCFHRVLVTDAGNVPALFYLGRFALQEEQYDSAVVYFRELIRNSPEYPDGWINLAIAFRNQEQPDSAMAVLNQALDNVTVSRGDVRFYLAQLLSRNDHTDSALAVLRVAIAEGEDTIRALFEIGAIYEQTGEFEKAVETFERLLAVDPAHAQTLNYLGYMLADRDIRLEESLRLIERALEIDSANGAYIDSYAWVLYRLDRFEEALAQIEKAVELLPDDPIVREHLGDIYFALGLREAALEAWEQALAMDPDNQALIEKLSY